MLLIYIFLNIILCSHKLDIIERNELGTVYSKPQWPAHQTCEIIHWIITNGQVSRNYVELFLRIGEINLCPGRTTIKGRGYSSLLQLIKVITVTNVILTVSLCSRTYFPYFWCNSHLGLSKLPLFFEMLMTNCWKNMFVRVVCLFILLLVDLKRIFLPSTCE